MTVLALLIPVSLGLGLLGLAAFFWSLRADQYDDPEGQAHRILSDRYDDAPMSDSAQAPGRQPPESGVAGEADADADTPSERFRRAR
ncbi:cbb3-type cytochrome oxidase assembly protein CcoS [Rhodobacteraceae bacterium KN286]|uniref:Cbb3-type cytochrome oxidase assembly protein CcoS n=1 Tax=Oceanomicrobium pacificus TaxID=2692916 RepID=A0A6B0TVJ8_9RHOB|nr:cbb3-type cytochrome oxidase assembly protein CcoS [Oceanomicrobium pacificus]